MFVAHYGMTGIDTYVEQQLVFHEHLTDDFHLLVDGGITHFARLLKQSE